MRPVFVLCGFVKGFSECNLIFPATLLVSVLIITSVLYRHVCIYPRPIAHLPVQSIQDSPIVALHCMFVALPVTLQPRQNTLIHYLFAIFKTGICMSMFETFTAPQLR